MSNIIEVKKAVVKFLKENINSFDIKVVKMEKVQDNWHTIAEVYEDDSFLKSMNLPPKQIRLYYLVKMDEKLEIISFERLSSFEGTDSLG